MSYYGLDELPPIADFVSYRDGVREKVLVRETSGELELAVVLPAVDGSSGQDAGNTDESIHFDDLCQVVEGVSHFVLIAERARCDLPVTQLELELQAEIDKFVLLGVDTKVPLARGELMALRAGLFDSVRFLHAAGTEQGERYRVANRTAAQLAARIDARYLKQARFAALQRELRRFYRAGQAAKLSWARAA